MTDEIARASRFLDAYSTIEDVLRKRLDGESGHRLRFYELVDRAVDRKLIVESQRHPLKKAGDLRNAIVHERGAWGGSPVADPREDFTTWLERQADVISNPPRVRAVLNLKPPLVLDEAENLRRFLSLVKDDDFSQAPVRLAAGGLGLVTTNALARWMVTAHEPGQGFILEDATIGEILKFAEATDVLKVRKKDLTAGGADVRRQRDEHPAGGRCPYRDREAVRDSAGHLRPSRRRSASSCHRFVVRVHANECSPQHIATARASDTRCSV